MGSSKWYDHLKLSSYFCRVSWVMGCGLWIVEENGGLGLSENGSTQSQSQPQIQWVSFGPRSRRMPTGILLYDIVCSRYLTLTSLLEA